jgi:hypothetical protein
MPVKKHYLLKVIAMLGIFNLLWLIFLIFATKADYTIVPISETYTGIRLLYLPICLTTASILVFFFDLIRHKEKNWFAFFAAFIALLPDAVFVIGSLWFLR